MLGAEREMPPVLKMINQVWSLILYLSHSHNFLSFFFFFGLFCKMALKYLLQTLVNRDEKRSKENKYGSSWCQLSAKVDCKVLGCLQEKAICPRKSNDKNGRVKKYIYLEGQWCHMGIIQGIDYWGLVSTLD